MTDRESQNFRFRIDEMNPDALFQDEMGQQRVDKLSQRVTIISILVPCLVGIMLFLGYLQVKQSMSGIQDSGADQVKKLSAEFQIRFDNIEDGQKKIEAALTLKMSQLEKDILFLKENLKKTDIRLNKAQETLGTASRNLSTVKSESVNKDAFEEIQNKVTALNDYVAEELAPKLVQEMDQQTKALESRLAEQLKELEETRKTLDGMRNELADLSEMKMDRKELALTLLNEQQRFQERLDKNSRQVKKQLEGISPELEKLRSLEHQVQEIKEALRALQSPAPSPALPVRPSSSTQPAPTALPASAQVREQDLR